MSNKAQRSAKWLKQQKKDARLGREIIHFLWAVQTYKVAKNSDEAVLAANVGRLGRKILERIIFEDSSDAET